MASFGGGPDLPSLKTFLPCRAHHEVVFFLEKSACGATSIPMHGAYVADSWEAWTLIVVSLVFPYCLQHPAA